MEEIKKGSTVLYVALFDADKSETPNINPAIVTKVQADGSLDLVVHSINGVYFKEGAPNSEDDKSVRGSWHRI